MAGAAAGGALHARHHHRQPGGHHRRLLHGPAMHPARPVPAHGSPPHLARPRKARSTCRRSTPCWRSAWSCWSSPSKPATRWPGPTASPSPAPSSARMSWPWSSSAGSSAGRVPQLHRVRLLRHRRPRVFLLQHAEILRRRLGSPGDRPVHRPRHDHLEARPRPDPGALDTGQPAARLLPRPPAAIAHRARPGHRRVHDRQSGLRAQRAAA